MNFPYYAYVITQFGAPNGLCSSITESKHIKAVKKPIDDRATTNPWANDAHCQPTD